jgi:hypothetical protein
MLLLILSATRISVKKANYFDIVAQCALPIALIMLTVNG